MNIVIQPRSVYRQKLRRRKRTANDWRTYIEWEHVDLEDKVHRCRVNEPDPSYLERRMTKYTPLDKKTGERIVVEKPAYPVTPLTYYPFGFVAGCIWGDDSSWKIQYLDLSEVAVAATHSWIAPGPSTKELAWRPRKRQVKYTRTEIDGVIVSTRNKERES